MELENSSTITRDEVLSVIQELEEETETRFVVYRAKNDIEIESFSDRSDAIDFIINEDYDTERVKVREQEGGDAEDRDELDSLRAFDAEACQDISEWENDCTLYSNNIIDEDFARRRAQETAPRFIDFDVWPYDLINWSDAAERLKDDSGEYATLNNTMFYYL